MKEGHYLIIFCSIILVSLLALDHRANALSVMTIKDETYDSGAEEAAQTAYSKALSTQDMTTVDLKQAFTNGTPVFRGSNTSVEFKEAFIDYFFKEIYAKYYAYRNEAVQTRIQTSFPVIAFVDMNGITINYIKQNSEGEIFRIFSEEISWPDTSSPLNKCKNNSKDFYIYWEEIENTLNYFINNFGNRGTPLQEGISINLERINSSKSYIGDEIIGIYVLSVTNGAYDKYTTRYRLASLNKVILADYPYYIINKNKSSGIFEYHLEDCDLTKDAEIIMYKSTKDECAMYGAYPCAQCQP